VLGFHPADISVVRPLFPPAQWPPRCFRLSQALEFRFVFATNDQSLSSVH